VSSVAPFPGDVAEGAQLDPPQPAIAAIAQIAKSRSRKLTMFTCLAPRSGDAAQSQSIPPPGIAFIFSCVALRPVSKRIKEYYDLDNATAHAKPLLLSLRNVVSRVSAAQRRWWSATLATRPSRALGPAVPIQTVPLRETDSERAANLEERQDDNGVATRRI
jgi:hypothetical protein